MTTPLYLENSYQYQSSATILAVTKDERGIYFLLDQTIFYPQGGGQPADQGKIIYDKYNIDVIHVRQIGDEIRHYITDKADALSVGKEVNCIVDDKRRILNARYHTAGHLLSNVVESIYPILKAKKGHSFPNEAYVGFLGSTTIEQNLVHDALKEAIHKSLTIKALKMDPLLFENIAPDNKEFRVVQIGEYPSIPCGGTHLANTNEIVSIELSKISIKKDVVNISYELP
jgi:alanyl-tRNA synthetase